MTTIKVKSHRRNGKKVRAHTRELQTPKEGGSEYTALKQGLQNSTTGGTNVDDTSQLVNQL